MMKNEDIKDSFFKVLDSIYVFFVKGESALFVAFAKVIYHSFIVIVLETVIFCTF